MLSEETKATLLRLADFALTIPFAKWDLETWWCGTCGCLIGNAIAKGLLPGLWLETKEFNQPQNWTHPRSAHAWDFAAVAEVIGIPTKDVTDLFSPDEVLNEDDGEHTRQLTCQELSDNIRYYVEKNS